MTQSSAPDSDDYITAHEVLCHFVENLQLHCELNADAMTKRELDQAMHTMRTLSHAASLVLFEIKQMTDEA